MVKAEQLFVVFTDLKRAFDSINTRVIMNKIWKVGVKGKKYDQKWEENDQKNLLRKLCRSKN